MNKINTGYISIQKWANLQKSEYRINTSAGQNKLFSSVADTISENKNKTIRMSAKDFLLVLVEQFTNKKLDLNKNNSSIGVFGKTLRIVPKEQKLFEGEEITIGINS